jgi:cobalamin biosynthesis protein CobT
MMYNINELNKALPLVASILGKKYGVQVQIGGDVACTDGKVIRLPTMPLETDENLRNLTRSFLDHESAHIRETDFEVLKGKGITPLVKHIWNVFEDWRVEGLLAKRFPGCRKNFSWLIKREFTKKLAIPKNPAMQIINYLLLSVRAWDVSEVERNRDIVGEFFKQAYPVLYDKINALLDLVKAKCKSSKDALEFAKDVESLLKAEAISLENKAQKQDQNSDKKSKQAKNAKCSPSSKAVDGLQQLLKSADDDLPKDISKIIAEELESAAPNNPMRGLSVAVESGKHFKPIEADDFQKISRTSTALHTRLHSLLQSTILVRRSGSRHGKLDTNRLYRLNHDSKVFLREGERQGISTAVHILLDASSSMRHKMDLASSACYTIANSLHKINGISVGVTAFPADPVLNRICASVSPMLKHGQNLHKNFCLRPSGSTPMGEAIWWTLGQCLPLKENRKIILIITDGKADSIENTEKAIEHGRKLGFEFYGVGINDVHIKQLLPQNSRIVKDLNELAPAMFKLLQDAMIK